MLFDTPDTSALTTIAYTPDSADHLVNASAHHSQWISEIIPAQTFSGTVKAQIQFLEADTRNNLFFAMKIYVVSTDGSTVLATLMALTRDTTTEFATSLTNRNFPSTSISGTTSADGRLVIELGWGGTPTGAGGVQGHNGSMRFGCSATSGDLPENDTETGTTFRPWIEFSNTIQKTLTPTRGLVSFAVAEAPFKGTRGLVSFAEAEAPFKATRGLVSFAEAEVPIAPTRGRVSWAEAEVPSTAPDPTRGLISFAEAEAPNLATRGLISHAEAEAPLAPTRGKISWAEAEVPLTPTRGLISFAEAEVPSIQPTRGLISWSEVQVPSVEGGESGGKHKGRKRTRRGRNRGGR